MMFHMNKNLKIVLAVELVDLRKSFNGLYAIAHNVLGELPEEGALLLDGVDLRGCCVAI
jgi:transposase